MRGRVGWKVIKPKLLPGHSSDGSGAVDAEHSKLLLHYFDCVSEFSFGKHPDVSCIGIQTWLALLKNFSFLPRTQCPLMAAKLWELLHLRYAHTHFRVASFLYALQKLANCEHVIAEAVLHPRAADYVEGYRYTPHPPFLVVFVFVLCFHQSCFASLMSLCVYSLCVRSIDPSINRIKSNQSVCSAVGNAGRHQW